MGVRSSRMKLAGDNFDFFEHQTVRFGHIPMPCPFHNQPLVFGVGKRRVVFFLGDVSQDFKGMIAVAASEYMNFLATIPVFIAVKDNKIRIAHIVHNAPDLPSCVGEDIGGATLAQLGMTRDSEMIVGQAGDAEKLGGGAAALHLLPIHIRTVGEVIHA